MGDADAGLGERPEPVRGDRRPHLLQHALHHAAVQLAHDILVVFRNLAERALPQLQLGARPAGHNLRREPDLGQGDDEPIDSLAGVDLLVGGPAAR